MMQGLDVLGITGNTAKVFEALLHFGSSGAGALIKETKLHRNLVYEALDHLVSEGLVRYVVVHNKKVFSLVSSQELAQIVSEKKRILSQEQEHLDRVLVTIEHERASESFEHEVSVHKGKRALKAVLEAIVDSKEELLVFGSGWGLHETLRDYYSLWHVKLRKVRRKARILLPQNKRNAYEKPFVARYLSEVHVMPTTIAVYGNRTVTVLWGEEPLVVVTLSEKVAEGHRRYFELLWKMGKK